MVSLQRERRRCKTCHVQFTRPLGSRRIYCEVCRPPRVAKSAVDGRGLPVGGAELPSGGLQVASGGAELPSGGVKLGPMGQLGAQVVAELTKYDRLNTVEGVLALKLAFELDFGRHTGAQTAALASRLLETKKAALEGADTREPDSLDELAARRDRKSAGA